MPTQLFIDPNDLIIIGVDREPNGSVESARVDQRGLEFGANEGDEDLVRDVYTRGVRTPVAARKVGDTYECIDGVRRTIALRDANELRVKMGESPHSLPVIVDHYDDLDALRNKIALNRHRADDDPIALGRMFKTVVDALMFPENKAHAISSQQAHEKVGRDGNCSESKVRQYIQFLDLSPDVQDQVRKGTLGIAAAVSLRNLAPAAQSAAATKLVSSGKGKDAQAARQVRDEVKGKTDTIPKVPVSVWNDIFTVAELEKNDPDMKRFLPLVNAVKVVLGKAPLSQCQELMILVERVTKVESK